MFKHIKSLLNLSATPPSVVYPYPFLALLAFSLSGVFNIVSLIKAVILSFLFQAAANLWNHVNDVEEDKISGKRNILTENEKIRKIVFIISPLLYLMSFSLSVLWVVDKRGVIAFAAVAFVTWIYSDKFILGRKIKRWKDHYITEVLTYLIAIPSFTSLLWTLFAPLSLKSTVFSIIMTFFGLSTTFLKDIKDITGDRLAGLKTLAVVFSPGYLLKIALSLLTSYYFLILFLSIYGLLPQFCIMSVIASAGLIYTMWHFISNGWSITLKSLRPIKVMVCSNLISLSLLIIAGIVQTLSLSVSVKLM